MRRKNDSSWYLRLYLDWRIRHSTLHFWVNVLSGLRLVSRCRLVSDTRALPITICHSLPFTAHLVRIFTRNRGLSSDSTTTRREDFLWSRWRLREKSASLA